MKRFYLPLIIMMSFALVLSACKKDEDDDDPGLPPGTFMINGYSQDAVNFTSMAGAMVTVSDANGAQVAQVLTDAAGNYSVAVAAGTYSLSVAKDGYQTQSAPAVMVGNANLP
jgi:hypothetical protein